MASTIGIKVADGQFYPIMEENSSVKKRLVLTTVHDNQKSAQIDLYNSFARTMADALYVGSLVVENIKPRPKGEPSIEMILASNTAGELSADIRDLDASVSGGHQHLSVSLTSMEEELPDGEIPDFVLESPSSPQELHPPRGLYEPAAHEKDTSVTKAVPLAWPLGPIAAIAVLVLLLICGLAYFFFLNDTGIEIRTGGNRRAATVEPLPAEPAPVTPAPAAQTPSPPPAVPVISASSQADRAAPGAEGPDRKRTLPPVASYKVPQTIPRGGAPYTIRWGDTLWDISEAFYRNPWQYRRIAQFNNIRNPDRIISGRTIRIPPRQ
jgi:LysM repeat protein